MKKSNNLFSIIVLCFFFVSCGEKENTELRPKMADYVYSVTYKKDSIFINKQKQNKKDSYLLTLYFMDGEYYIKDGDKNGTLFLSTKRDTVIDCTISSYGCKIYIKCGDDGTEYCTTVFLKEQNDVDSTRIGKYFGDCVPKETLDFLMSYHYDTEYYIKTIHEANLVSFQ